MSNILLASSIAMMLLQPLVLLGVVADPVIVAIVSWVGYLINSTGVIWQWLSKRKTLVEDFLSKWEHAFRNDSQSTCDIKAYIQELGTIIDALSKR